MTRQIMTGAVVGFVLTAGGLWLLGRVSVEDGQVDAGPAAAHESKRPDPSLLMQRVGPRALQPLRIPGIMLKDAGA